MKSYRPEELFDEDGRLLAGTGGAGAARAIGAWAPIPHANGGLLLRDLRLPDFREYAVDVPAPGSGRGRRHARAGHVPPRCHQAERADQRNFRIFGPDETASNRLSAVFEATDRAVGCAKSVRTMNHLAPDGRVMEVLSEHQCQGWLEGYLLTGRHGLFNCYEAFIHIVDSMFNQHAKWLKVTLRHSLAAADRVAELPAGSHVWRQDHNGFTHQDPGFIDHVVNKKAEVVRVYLPPDANCLLSVMDHCLRSRHYVNVVVAGKQPAPQWLEHGVGGQALHGGHRHLGMGQQRQGRRARCGDGLCRRRARRWRRSPPSMLLRQHLPELKIRVVNVVDLMKLQPRQRASARPERRGFRRAVHEGQAGHLRLPRLSLADPPPDLSPHQSPQHARSRLQGRRHDHHAVRHGGAERSGSVPSWQAT